VILVDSSIWIDHLRHDDAQLRASLQATDVLCHPFIAGEIAMGSVKDRAMVLRLLDHLPRARTAREGEVRQMIDHQRLFGLGLGYIDAHLLAATLITPDALLWTRDRRLRDAAARLGISASFT
jgi:predicted nucleic acid-binding protein